MADLDPYPNGAGHRGVDTSSRGRPTFRRRSLGCNAKCSM